MFVLKNISTNLYGIVESNRRKRKAKNEALKRLHEESSESFEESEEMEEEDKELFEVCFQNTNCFRNRYRITNLFKLLSLHRRE